MAVISGASSRVSDRLTRSATSESAPNCASCTLAWKAVISPIRNAIRSAIGAPSVPWRSMRRQIPSQLRVLGLRSALPVAWSMCPMKARMRLTTTSLTTVSRPIWVRVLSRLGGGRRQSRAARSV